MSAGKEVLLIGLDPTLFDFRNAPELGVLIGAGVRLPPSSFVLSEKLINVVHEHALGAEICFNTNPRDTVEAVQRWL